MRKSLKIGAALLMAALLSPISPISTGAAAAQDLTNGGRAFSGSADVFRDLPGSGPELSQVDYVDPEKYVGTWYQVATVPQPYTLQCTNDTKAEYELLNPTTISVRNSCGSQISSASEIRGTATVRDTNTNASLRVNFPGVPFQNEQGAVNYRITYLADDYSLAIVGDPQRRSGFVLSRTQNLSPDQWNEVRDTVANRGYWDCSFLTVPMAGGRKDTTPLCLI